MAQFVFVTSPVIFFFTTLERPLCPESKRGVHETIRRFCLTLQYSHPHVPDSERASHGCSHSTASWPKPSRDWTKNTGENVWISQVNTVQVIKYCHPHKKIPMARHTDGLAVCAVFLFCFSHRVTEEGCVFVPEVLPFSVAFFSTFMAYSCPVSGPFVFLTKNTCQ